MNTEAAASAPNTATVIPMTMNRYKDGLESDHVLVTPSGHRHGVGSIPKGMEARQEHQGPVVPGPWAYAFGKCTVIDRHGGTGAEMASLDKAGKVHHVKTGDLLEIDGVTYAVRVYRREYIELRAVA